MESLVPNTTYHIFNHANGFENVFREDENFRFFLNKYRLYISPVAETYAYCLMPNHFHLVVRIRKREVIEEMIRNKSKLSNSTFTSSKVRNFGSEFGRGEIDKLDNIEDVDIKKFLSKQFANFFSSYTQAYNKMYKRMGSLFVKNFKREIITDKDYFVNAIVYTHRNPIHHGFCTLFTGWRYSSYNEIIEQQSDILDVEKTAKVFGCLSIFEKTHRRHLEKFNQVFDLETP